MPGADVHVCSTLLKPGISSGPIIPAPGSSPFSTMSKWVPAVDVGDKSESRPVSISGFSVVVVEELVDDVLDVVEELVDDVLDVVLEVVEDVDDVVLDVDDVLDVVSVSSGFEIRAES